MSIIEVTTSETRGRGVVATRPIPAGTSIIRALPFALVPIDRAREDHCCVCVQHIPAGLRRAPCGRCNSLLCERCAAASGPARIHEDECDALSRLAQAPKEMRPTDTSSLRLLIRSLCARWRSARQPSEEQYIAADGTWWGDGDIAADDFDDNRAGKVAAGYFGISSGMAEQQPPTRPSPCRPPGSSGGLRRP